MRVTRTIKSLRKAIQTARLRKGKLGFVPTMGAFHAGHLSLFRKARQENEIVVVSIFVNPKQFGPAEDFDRYPRPEKNDLSLAKKEKVDIIFYPSEKEMYPTSYLTYIQVEKISHVLCGGKRPGHFRGVATVVGKLLNIVSPDRLYLGQKDAQQTVVLEQMIQDLNIPVQVRICPIIRENDGLAMSSRNKYLTVQQRKEAAILYQTLKAAQKTAMTGRPRVASVLSRMKSNITKNSTGQIDYIECVNARTLAPLKRFEGKIMIALAVKFGQTRLIDNIVFHRDDD